MEPKQPILAAYPAADAATDIIVRALMQDSAGVIFAGTEGDGVLASFDDGITWQSTNEGLTVNRVFALGLDGHGYIVAGTSAGVFRRANVPAPKEVGRPRGESAADFWPGNRLH